MKKTSMTIEDLRTVKIPVKLHGIPHYITSVKPFGIGNDSYAIETVNIDGNTFKGDIILPFTKEYNTCVRAVNRWIKKELTKRLKERN